MLFHVVLYCPICNPIFQIFSCWLLHDLSGSAVERAKLSPSSGECLSCGSLCLKAQQLWWQTQIFILNKYKALTHHPPYVGELTALCKRREEGPEHVKCHAMQNIWYWVYEYFIWHWLWSEMTEHGITFSFMKWKREEKQQYVRGQITEGGIFSVSLEVGKAK